MPEPTYEELKARLVELEQKNSQLVAKNAAITRKPTFFVTEEEDLFQIRWLEGQAVNLKASTVRWIIENAQNIIPFLSTNKNLLSDPSDYIEVRGQKLCDRIHAVAADNPVVRPKKDISWREKKDSGVFE